MSRNILSLICVTTVMATMYHRFLFLRRMSLRCRTISALHRRETFCRDMFNALYQDRDENFGNARDVRNIFERSVANQANRLAAMEAPTKEDLMTFLKADIVGEKPED